MEITPLGDSALLVRVREASADPDEETARAVLEALNKIKGAHIPGVIEVAPAYTSIGVFYDPRRVVTASTDALFESLAEQIRQAVSRARRQKPAPAARLVEIPVCYDRAFALDLDEVATKSGLTPDEIVHLHCRQIYRVNCLGFTPGFPYLSGLPAALATPRRPVPRKEVPAGSVAIGGKQTGIYPIKSPGGWNIIGRTPLNLFDATKTPPALLQAGDRVRFRSITPKEFEALKK